MRHRIRIDAAFASKTDAEFFMVQAKTAIGKCNSINEDKANAEISYIDYHKCYHDETPTRPCETIERHEVMKGVVKAIKEAISPMEL